MSDTICEIEPFVGETKHEYIFTWTIEKFSDFTGKILSKKFSMVPMCCSEWRVALNESGTEVLLGLKRVDKHSHNVSVECVFTLRNSRDTFFDRITLKALFLFEGESKFSEQLFNKPSKSRSVKANMGGNFMLCSDDILKIEGKIVTVSCCHENEPMSGNIAEFQQDFRMILQDSLFTDVKFIIGNESLPAHKIILAARSPVFRTMFQVDMKENASNTINITDIDKPVLEAFLLFIYTGVLGGHNEDMDFTIDLYSVADKYDVSSLKNTCRHKIISMLSEDTVCHILNVACIHNDENLQDVAFNYLCDNFLDVEETEHWQKFAEHTPTLAAKAVCKFASKLRNN